MLMQRLRCLPSHHLLQMYRLRPQLPPLLLRYHLQLPLLLLHYQLQLRLLLPKPQYSVV
jgi:hypothetical protein